MFGSKKRERDGGSTPAQPPVVARAADDALLWFSPRDPWTIRDACEGTQVFGSTGSGKTSGSGATIASSFLRAGFGGLVLTAKPEDVSLWREACTRAGRADDLRIVEPGGGGRLNFLAYEAARPDGAGKTTYDLVSLLLVAMQAGRVRESREPFWDDAVRQLLTNAIDLVLHAKGSVGLGDVVSVIRSAPTSNEDVESLRKCDLESGTGGATSWASRSACAAALGRAAGRCNRREIDSSDFAECVAFWTEEFPALARQTRAAIVTTFMSKATALLRRPFRELFCGSTTDDSATTYSVVPEVTFAGRIVVLNLPVKAFGDAGRLAQILYKTLWQRSVERRTDTVRPVFLWADESQYFTTPLDMTFQQTARSARAATVYLTQSISNYYAMLGEGERSPAVTDSLLGNLQTKIFHANSDPVTNEWAERVFGRRMDTTRSQGMDTSGTLNIGAQQTFLPVVPAIEFTRLKKGGPSNDYSVEGFVFGGGRTWLDGDAKASAMKFVFKQAT